MENSQVFDALALSMQGKAAAIGIKIWKSNQVTQK